MSYESDYIQRTYGVPAKKGQRVEYAPTNKPARQGVITGFHNQYIKIKFDGDAKVFPGVFHPTDCMRYIT